MNCFVPLLFFVILIPILLCIVFIIKVVVEKLDETVYGRMLFIILWFVILLLSVYLLPGYSRTLDIDIFSI